MNGHGKAVRMGRVTFVGAGPGDPDLITLRGWRALQAAEVVLYDSLVDTRLLAEVTGRLLYVGKRCGKHAMPQEEISRLLAAQARKGLHVVRLKGGDGAVLGRLGEEMLYLARHNVPYEVVPGVTSATAVPAFAGIPVTHRGLADSFAVITAHRREDDGTFSIPPYRPTTTLVLLMSLGTTAQWREQLLAQGYPADLPVAFVSQGGSEAQRVLVTTLAEAATGVARAGLVSPTLAVVGRVVSLRERLAWYPAREKAALPEAALPEPTARNMMVGGD